MILTVFRISALRLLHNKSELLLTFVVPIAFFSIFALIFGNRGNGGSQRVRIAICDEAQTESSSAARRQIEKQAAIRIFPEESTEKLQAIDRTQLVDWVRRGIVQAGVLIQPESPLRVETAIEPTKVVPENEVSELTKPSAGSLANQAMSNTNLQVKLLTDSYDQVTAQVLTALLQKAILSSAQMPTAGMPSIESHDQRSSVSPAAHWEGAKGVNATLPTPPEVRVVDILGVGKSNPSVAMYAAGIAVMFLLFSSVSTAGAILEEREKGTFERLMTSQLSIDELLMGKWLYMVALGSVQVALMFAWGHFVFHVDVLSRIDGFLAMSLVTVCSAASFALMLATLCQTKNQLHWISIVIILAMSALGGSMVPRYLMSEQMKYWGGFTFNAWALDGYNKIFWRNLGIADLTVELAVLTTCGFIFLALARLAIVRWSYGR